MGFLWEKKCGWMFSSKSPAGIGLDAFASPWFRPSLIALVVGMLLPFSLVGNEGQEVRCFVEDSREPVVE